MRVVIGLGGNALLRRGEPLTHEAQRRNVVAAAAALEGLARAHEIVVTHGNGPQVGLLATQDEAMPGSGDFPLDVLSAETEGMIGYLLAQELRNRLPERSVATLVTQVEVRRDDPAFAQPSKPVGPMYDREQARSLGSARGWNVARDGDGFRRVVPSPLPVRLLEIDTIHLLVDAGTVVVCAGGGGIPVVFDDWGRAHGVEAVVDKDRAAALLAVELAADALLLLTDVEGIYAGWGTADAALLPRLTPERLASLELAAGSMGPKASAALDFVRRTGGFAGIGSVQDAEAILAGRAGTRIVAEAEASPAWSRAGGGEPVSLALEPVLASLRRNAEAIRTLVSDVEDGQARWKPSPDAWSILEVVTHLADEEAEDFRARLESTLVRPGAAWSPIDPEAWAVERRYNEGILSESLDRFMRERSESLSWLASLPRPDWSASYEHPRFGPIRAGDLLTAWVAHDHIHIRQLNRLHREYLVSSVSGYSARYAGRW